MKKRVLAAMLAGVMVLGLAGCGGSSDDKKEDAKTEDTAKDEDKESDGEQFEDTTITIFAAKSLNGVMDELCEKYNSEHPNVTFQTNYDSSGTLMTQIKEGAKCNIFFSASVSQMDELQAGFDGGDIVEGSRRDLLNNQVCLVTWKGSDTKVTDFSNLSLAKNMALADQTVPVGQYTRKALINAGMAGSEYTEVDQLTDDVISKALGGLEINNCANVGAVTSAVAEGSNEVGTVYYSDTYGLEDRLKVLQVVPYDLTGNVIYPAAQVVNKEADESEQAAAKDFVEFLTSDEAAAIFRNYYFDTEVE